MQRIFLKISAVALLMNLAAYGQSLADVARQYKEKQDAAQTSGAKPKVITNQDLGEGPEGHPELRVERRANWPTTTASAAGSPAFERPYGEMNRHPENPFSQGQAQGQGQGQHHGQRTDQLQGQMQGQGQRQTWSGQRLEPQGPEAQGGSEQWRQRVLEQESRVASMQARIDQLNAAAHSGGASAQGPYNRYQARQMERAQQMQQQLDEQKRRLESMQEAARRQGMHTQVYDP
jgi:hypothetical protein